MKRTITKLLAGVAVLVCSSVQAAPVCGELDFLTLFSDDVTFMNAGGTQSTAATDCGNPTRFETDAAIDSALQSDGLTGFTALTGSMELGASATGGLNGARFTFGVTGSGDRGDWTLAWSGVNGPITIDLVAVVQSTTRFAWYFFDNLDLTSTPGAGHWLNEFPGLEGNTTLAFFARDLQIPVITPPPPSEVSEPATLLLFGLATLGLAIALRMPRRVRKR